MIQTKTIVTISLVAVLGILGSFSVASLFSEEAYAPSGRRGYYCEWSTESGWANVAMPFPYVFQQVAL